jgi:hypothetical protein
MKKTLDCGRLAYDPVTPNFDYTVFNNNADWTSFYGNVIEEQLPKMPKPKGNPVTISAFVDANHNGNVKTPFPQWNTNICTECTYHMVLEVTEHEGRVNFQKQVCGIVDLSGYVCCIAV